jgi:hypothetical protein
MTPNDYSDTLHTYLLTQEQSTEDNDRLFYCSYLLGHLSLASSSEPENCDLLNETVSQSLASAFAIDHLTDADKSGIQALWDEAVTTARN